MGSALAFWLTRLEPSASVVVVERDPTYATASSALSAASIRQQFTTPVNIRIAQASIDILRATGGLLEVDGARPDIGLTEAGYLFLAGEAGVKSLRQAHAIQTQHGAEVALLAPAELAERFPWLETADLAAGRPASRDREFRLSQRILGSWNAAGARGGAGHGGAHSPRPLRKRGPHGLRLREAARRATPAGVECHRVAPIEPRWRGRVSQ